MPKQKESAGMFFLKYGICVAVIIGLIIGYAMFDDVKRWSERESQRSGSLSKR